MARAKKTTEIETKVKRDMSVIGDALNRAGFDPDKTIEQMQAEQAAKNYRVSFTYEKDGRRLDNQLIIRKCANAWDAQEEVKNDSQRRGIDPETIEFLETIEHSDPLPVEAQVDAFPETKQAPIPEPVMALDNTIQFQAKLLGKMDLNRDTKTVTIKLICGGSDVEKIIASSFHLEKEDILAVTMVPIQIKVPAKHLVEAPAQENLPVKTDEPAEDVLDYTCPYCSNVMTIAPKPGQKAITCTSCGKAFPIDFPEAEGAEDEEAIEPGMPENHEAAEAAIDAAIEQE